MLDLEKTIFMTFSCAILGLHVYHRNLMLYIKEIKGVHLQTLRLKN